MAMPECELSAKNIATGNLINPQAARRELAA
jgi:hypothetical protein